jgi:hypothetical protein
LCEALTAIVSSSGTESGTPPSSLTKTS